MLFDNSMLNVYKIVSKYRRFTNHDPIEGDWDSSLMSALAYCNLLQSLQTMTRLKGIETFVSDEDILTFSKFTNHDPIEGDWDQALLGLGFRD